ncbi:MAG: hypothetical protein V3T77_06450, partial [Planctomycetota bacterium]
MHSKSCNPREQGSALAYAMICAVFLFALMGGVTEICLVDLKATHESKERVRAFYLADSGLQIGNALVRSTGTSLTATTLVEDMFGGTVTIDITPISASLYRITSTAGLGSQQSSVEMVVRFEADFVLEGAFEVAVGSGVDLEGSDFPVEVRDTAVISGRDHTPSGTLKGVQDDATQGLALNSLAGSLDWDTNVDAGATLEGDPSSTINDAVDKSTILKALRDEARNNADISLSGSQTF